MFSRDTTDLLHHAEGVVVRPLLDDAVALHLHEDFTLALYKSLLQHGLVHAFDVLGDPVRRRILQLLADGERSAGTISDAVRDEFGISQPAVSQHLRVLRENGFASVRAEGARRLYAVAPAPLREVDTWLDQFRHVWDQPLGAIDRTVERRPREDGGEDVAVVARRTYDADATDVWDALTDPARIARWFMPISGDLRKGGNFQLEGNAGGDILECAAPHRFRVTFGSEVSIVEVRLTREGERTALVLEHTVPIEMAQSGAGALWVGPGWDGAVMGLGLYLAGEAPEDPVAAASSPEVVAFNEKSVRAWAAAVESSGTSTAEQLAEAVKVSLAQFAPGTAGTEPSAN
jgi:DNA-binding transcriptional ArsR family regulator/uncharacterized protein YndB with AHSA1/START domain